MGSANDPIADLLTRLRNASAARHLYIDVSYSKMKEAIVKILKEKGFVSHYLIKEEKKRGTMRIFLKYAAHREPVIHGLKRVSKPSYIGSKLSNNSFVDSLDLDICILFYSYFNPLRNWNFRWMREANLQIK